MNTLPSKKIRFDSPTSKNNKKKIFFQEKYKIVFKK
jgi:hypothetical protein